MNDDGLHLPQSPTLNERLKGWFPGYLRRSGFALLCTCGLLGASYGLVYFLAHMDGLVLPEPKLEVLRNQFLVLFLVSYVFVDMWNEWKQKAANKSASKAATMTAVTSLSVDWKKSLAEASGLQDKPDLLNPRHDHLKPLRKPYWRNSRRMTAKV